MTRLMLMLMLISCLNVRAGSEHSIDSLNYEKAEFVNLPDKIDKIPFSSLENLLQGKFAGLYVQKYSGTPGSQQKFSIRNVGNSGLESTPLVILNGITIFPDASDITGTNPLSSIVVDDISSIELVKDAAALAIYGSRGANGALIINTKKALAKSQVNINLTNGVSVGGDSYRDVIGGNLELQQLKRLYDNRNLLYPNNQVDYPLFVSNPKNSFYRSNDWQDDSQNLGKYLNYNFGISGTGVFGFYNISLGFLNQDGLTDDAKLQRYNLSINSRYNVTEKFGFDFYITGLQMLRERGSSTMLPPAYAPFTSDPVFPENVFISDNSAIDENVNNHVFTNAKVFYNFSDKLELTSMIGMVYENYRRDFFVPSTANNGVLVAAAMSSQNQRFISRTELSYKGNLGDRGLTAKAGFEITQTQKEYIGVVGKRYGSAFSDFVKVVQGYGRSQLEGGTSYSKISLISGYATFDYELTKNIDVTGTLRLDGSSQFTSENQFKLFPGLGIDWQLVENKDGLIKNANLKMGGAVTGLQSEIGSLYGGSMESIGSYLSVQAPTTVSAANNDLSFPVSKQFDISLNVDLNNGLWFGIEAYSKNISDYIINVPAQQFTGRLFDVVNGLDFSLTGLEFTLGLDKKIGNVDWSSRLVVSSVASEIKEIADNQTGLQKGESLSAIYAYKSSGKLTIAPVNSKTGRALNFEGTPFQVGLPAIVDANNDQFINALDKEVIADSQPKIFGGWNNQFSYKNFYIDAQVNFMSGAEIAVESRLERYANNSYLHALYPDNGKTTPYYFLQKNELGVEIQGISSIEKISYVRLNSLTVGYSFKPKDFFKAKDLNVYASATNLLTLSGYDGLNPEENSNGISHFNLNSTGTPLFRTVVLGVKVKF